MAKIDLAKFNKLVEDKYLTCQSHPTQTLLIWNYSQQCQFSHFWTEETKMARGLITDLEGNIVARPFSKFFNLLEHTGEDSKLPPLPIEEFQVYDKLDGSLGILYWIGDEPHLATRGSFTSEQAIKGTEILHKKYSHVKFNPNYTYLWEILYPENKIVVDYKGLEDIILLAQIHTESGEEVDAQDYADVLTVVKKYDGITDLSKLQEMEEDNKEGFVIRFKSGVRAKAKFSEYLRLHKICTQTNTKVIWEHLMKNEQLDELLERVPDEFMAWLKDTVAKLQFQYKEIEEMAKYTYKQVKNMETRKEQALFLKEYSEHPGVVFSMLDKKDYSQIIWKMIRPVAEKPYKVEI